MGTVKVVLVIVLVFWGLGESNRYKLAEALDGALTWLLNWFH